MSTYYSQKDSGVFVQFYPGGEVYYLGECVDLDSIPNPRWGGKEIRQCWKGDKTGFKTIGKSFTAPGALEYSIAELTAKTASWLEEMYNTGCAFILYALYRKTGDRGVWGGWERAYIVLDNDIVDSELQNVAHHEEDAQVMVEYSLSASPPRLGMRTLGYSERATTETEALNAVSACGDGACGIYRPYNRACNRWYAFADAGAAATANVLYSDDEGATWAATAADPFATDENILAGKCFPVTADTNRILCVRETDTAAALEVAYSDDEGATWTLVTVGATNGETVTGPHALFVLDWQHIWLCTDSGNVFFSQDGGLTWTDQGASGASGATQLNAVHFADENVGYAVGQTDTIIFTIDGGVHWAAGTATGTGDNLNDVICFSEFHVLVGTDSVAGDSLQVSFDGTTTWESLAFTGAATEEVTALSFVNELVGMMITNTSGPVGSVHLTINGGRTWEEQSTASNAGLNDIIGCAMDSFITVGEPSGGAAVIVSYG